MILAEFLVNKTLDAIEILPDQRLINVIVNGGALYGVVVDEIPQDINVTRYDNVVLNNNIISIGDLEFDTTKYAMLFDLNLSSI